MRLWVGEKEIVDESFVGFSRPWMGLHTIDTVRRDAAEEKVWFETEYDSSNGKAEVKLSSEEGEMIYMIDMERDVIERITFSREESDGELRFDYLQDIGEAGNEFVRPRNRKVYGREKKKGLGILWRVWLAEDGLLLK